MLAVTSYSAGDSAKAIANYVEQSGAEKYYGDGYWGGEGAKSMGLSGSLEAGELENYLAGRDPKTGEPLANKVDEEHKAGWDLTFSAPKSVSAIWAADPAERADITRAHEEAVKAAMAYLEKEAFFTRHGHGGAEHRPVMESGGLIYSVHHHAATRANDPGLHSHTIVANLTADGRGLDFDTRHKMVAGALYRAELSSQIKQLGYAIERDESSFKVVGVDQNLVENWSKRSEEIKEVMEERGLSGAESAAKIAGETRALKTMESEPEAFKRWEAEAKTFGYNTEKIKQAGIEAEPAQMPTPQQIINELMMNESTVSELQLKAASIQASQGHHNASHALSHHENIVSKDQSMVYLQSAKGLRVTTEQVIQREQAMLETAERMANKYTHTVTPEQLFSTAKWDSLKPEQKEAVAHLTTGADLVNLQGWAGTGKTYALGVAVEAWKTAGYQVIASAPSNKAVEELQKGAGLDEVINTTKLENQLARGGIQLNEKTVLIIDEAGMEGSRRIADLLLRAEAAGAKVVLQGDTKQLQAVEAGAAMRGIIEKVGAAELGHDSVTRQKSDFDKEIARDIRQGRGHEAIAKLEKAGSIQAHKDNLQVHKGAAAAYLNDLKSGKDSILVAFTKHEVNQLNQSVREALKASGAIEQSGHEYKTATGNKEFAPGDKLIFGKEHQFEKDNEDSRVINGSRGVVQAVAENALWVKLDKTQEVVKVEPATFDKIDHGHATTVHKSQGATADTAHVVVGERGSQEWAYVAASRHREEATIHTTEKILEREKMPDTGKEKDSIIEKTFERSSAKDLSTDYQRIDPPSPGQPPSPGKEAVAERSHAELQKTPPEQQPANVQSKDYDSAKPRLEPAAERSQAMPESRANTSDSNHKPRPEQAAERAQAMPKEQVKAADKDTAKPTPEQRQANVQKLNEAHKAKAAEVVKQTETIKENSLKMSVEKTPSKGADLGL